MTAAYPVDSHDRFQLTLELQKIKMECPTFVAWLKHSEEQTIEIIEASEGSYLLKQAGAVKDLRTILSIIDSPPPNEGINPDARLGMAVM